MFELQPRLLARAMEITGSATELCARLHVEEHALHLWMTRRARAPERVLLAIVDIVLEDDVARAAQDRRREPRTELAVINNPV
jgi:hypothetical protein